MEQKKILHLTLKKKWFDMIASGEKKEEYREIKPYWIKRFFNQDFGLYSGSGLNNYIKTGLELRDRLKNKGLNKFDWMPFFDVICFRNGYGSNAPQIIIELKGITIGKAKPEWSDNWQGDVFIIKLGEILSPNTQTI